MVALELLARALTQELGYRPLDGAEGLPPAAREFAFLGAKDHWGSVSSVALLRGDGLAPEALRAKAAAFHDVVVQLRQHAGNLVVVQMAGPDTRVQLGSFGVLCLVFEHGAPPAMVAEARALKRGALRDKTYALVWCLDAPARKVHQHKGLPLAVHPGPKALLRALG